MILPYIAATLLVGIGIAHSVLGERYVLRRLARIENLPRLTLRGQDLMIEVLRFAWHITTLAWVGFAGILILIAHHSLTSHSAYAVVSGTFLVSGIASLVGAKGRHYSWIFFLAIGFITLYGALD